MLEELDTAELERLMSSGGYLEIWQFIERYIPFEVRFKQNFRGIVVSNSLSISTAAYDGHNLAVALEEISSLRVNFVELAFIQGYTDRFTEDYFNKTNAGEIRRSSNTTGWTAGLFLPTWI